jgi:Fuc2NAc and GlcNAc transferase
MTAAELLGIAVAFAAAALLTAWVRQFALRTSLLDVPNARSSHVAATPRGGGLAIALVVVSAVVALVAAGRITTQVALGLGAGAAVIAYVGWRDDRDHLAARVRATVHIGAAAVLLYCLGGLPSLRLGTSTIHLGTAGSVLAILGVVWAVNFYNFMDGIDALAGTEAVVVFGAGAWILARHGAQDLATLSGVIAAAAAGFLVFNLPPARIFMGDVGSGMLGFCLGGLAVASERQTDVPLLAWLVLSGVFVTDATLTLARRVLRGRTFYEAHRDHAYQRATRAGLSHGAVTGRITVVNLGLAVAAWCVAALPAQALWIAAGSYAVLVALYYATERRVPMA